MEKSSSFVGVGGISCGESRGLQEISCLFDCKEDMNVQLSNCHLSKSNLRENELIAIRAGMFNLTEDQFKMMFICPSTVIIWDDFGGRYDRASIPSIRVLFVSVQEEMFSMCHYQKQFLLFMGN
jgi:hypothetical protein